MRLIDADAFRREAQEYVLPITTNNLMGAADAYHRIMHLLDDAPTIEAEPVKHGRCPYCEVETNDFIPLNQTVEYSGIEMALNRQGMLRVRVYEPGKTTFTTQDIVEIKRCPNCGAKMDGGDE